MRSLTAGPCPTAIQRTDGRINGPSAGAADAEFDSQQGQINPI